MSTSPSAPARSGSAPTPSAGPHRSAGPAQARLPFVVYVLGAGTFLMGTTEFIVAGLLPELAADFGTTEARAGLAITTFAVGMILGAPVLPMLTLRLSRRVLLTSALAVYAAAHVVSAATESFGLLLASRFVAAVATGTFWAVAAVVAARIAGPGRASTALGIVLGGGMLSTVVGVPLGAVAGQAIGWRGPFWALAALAVLAAVVVARQVPADPTGADARPRPSVRAEVASLRSARLWLVLLTCAAINAGVMSVYSFVSPLLGGRAGLGVSLVPLALVLFGLGTFVGNLAGGRLGESRPFAVLATAAGVTLVTVALLTVATSTVPAVLLFGLLGLVGLSANPVLVALAVRFGGDGATLPSAMATSMFNAGTAVGTAVTGALLTTSLGDASPALVGVVAAALVLVPVILLGRHGRLARGGAHRRSPAPSASL
ncbi:MFS transporter [Nocardioides dongxiaopingii]|uniref:MFS transporter n=1 Tax=Nocardioides sp. S-1144 TaxID=2582905 RepID=UPI001C9E923F|nr:MFS transporter [Nocardioides sp. S-1144]